MAIYRSIPEPTPALIAWFLANAWGLTAADVLAAVGPAGALDNATWTLRAA